MRHAIQSKHLSTNQDILNKYKNQGLKEAASNRQVAVDWLSNEVKFLKELIDAVHNQKPMRLFTVKEVQELLVDCAYQFGGSEIQDQFTSEQVINWFNDKEKLNTDAPTT